MNRPDPLTHLFRHHLWANLRLLESCAALPPEHLNASIPGSFGTLYETFQHIATSERSYFSRISTGQRYNAPPDEPPMTFDEIEQLLKTTGAGLIEWAARVQPDDMVMIDWEGTPREVAKTVLLTQVIQHASEHREQIKAIMTMLGIEPPDLQSWAYFDAGEPVLSA
ncbi:MAG: DinB family protein [Chloroflexota bacterium]|nr:DinB family protein [Chloroflexota bacterium]